MSDEIDLVITDMAMPKMTGDQLAAKLIKLKPDIPIILCTGYNKKISSESAAKSGIKALLLKPLLINELAAAIRNVLDAAKGEEESQRCPV